jgi:hypothetical protein
LKTPKICRLPNNRLESQGGLDIGDVLLATGQHLLLRSHLACKALLRRGVPLTGGREDVLEGFLCVPIGGIACALTALKQAHCSVPALRVGVTKSVLNCERLTKSRRIAKKIANGTTASASSLLNSSLHAWIQSANLRKTLLDLTLKLAADQLRSPGILWGTRHFNALVGGRVYPRIRSGGIPLNIAEELFV